MRYSEEHKRQTRERVVVEAAKAIRAEGPEGISVAGVMNRAGLTHGAFYAYFPSKDDLVAAGIDQMFVEGRARLGVDAAPDDPREALVQYVNFYLSRSHRDSRTTGCPLPFLAAEAPRLSGAARERFAAGAAGLTQRLGLLLQALDWPDHEVAAASLLAELVGALSLARAEPDVERSDAILAASRKSLRQRFALENVQ